jgi:uncharacterized MAPEG superfamily protein
MHFAFWMILVAALLPYVMAAMAKSGGGIDNASPRSGIDGLQGWRKRADWAERNHFEAFPAFAAAVIVAELARAPQSRIDMLAGLFVLCRVAYSAAYIGNRATLRSALWFGGMICVIALFCIGI